MTHKIFYLRSFRIRNLPRAGFLAFGITTVLFILANVAYFAVLPEAEILLAEQSIAAEFFQKLTLPFALKSVIFPILVGMSALGAVCCMSFTATRVILESARDGYIPLISKQLSHISRWNTPVAASILHLIITSVLIIAAPPKDGYGFMIVLSGYSAWMFYTVTVLGMIRLRFTMPNLERPFRAWLVFPVLFLLAAFFVTGWSWVPPFIPADRITQDGLPYFIPYLIGSALMWLTVPLWVLVVIFGKGTEKSMYGLEKKEIGDETVIGNDDDDDLLWNSKKV